MRPLRALAPAKTNLGLFVGPVRAHDRRHELVTVMQSISLADELELGPAAAGAREDEIVSPLVPGPAGANLAARALRAFRDATAWEVAPLRLEVRKRIPLAAGLGGGSADAACALRLCAAASGLGDERTLQAIARELGADVPAQLSPGRWLATGAGEELERLPDPAPPLSLLVIPSAEELSTAAVYARADELGAGRTVSELEELRARMRVALRDGAALPADTSLLGNDLEAAARALCAPLAGELDRVRATEAAPVFLSGSGPTVIVAGVHAPTIAEWQSTPIAVESVGAEFGAVHPASDGPVRHNPLGSSP
jgi:4-diphosphocytidyl-2-C-methyl-D-erythritol kinase